MRFNNLIRDAKLEHPNLVNEIDEIVGQLMSETDNQPSDSDLWDAEQYIADLIETNQEPLQEPTQ